MVDTIAPSNPMTVARAGVHHTIKPGWNGGIVRQIFSDKFNPVIDSVQV